MRCKMLLMKFVGGVFVIVCGTLCGVYASRIVYRRVKFMEQYLMFLANVRACISYTAASADEILHSENAQPLIKPILSDAAALFNSGQPFEKAWRKALSSNTAQMLVAKSDRELVMSFGDGFGTSDVQGELEKLDLCFHLAEQRRNEMRSELESKRRIYRIVGMFVGVVITVLIC